MKVTRVTNDEFEIEDGSVHPIIPSLEKETAPDEFQKHYDRACSFVEGCKDSGTIKSSSMGEGVAEKGVLKMDNLSIIKKPLDKKIKNQEPWERDVNEDRYIIIEKETGKIIDDAQGHGYKSFQSAKKAMWYRFGGGKKRTDTDKSEAMKFWKANPQVKKFVEDIFMDNVKEMYRGEVSEDDLIKEVNEKFNIIFDKKYLKYA